MNGHWLLSQFPFFSKHGKSLRDLFFTKDVVMGPISIMGFSARFFSEKGLAFCLWPTPEFPHNPEMLVDA
jgi:hypothetical protein